MEDNDYSYITTWIKSRSFIQYISKNYEAVINYISQGYTYKEIAKILNISNNITIIKANIDINNINNGLIYITIIIISQKKNYLVLLSSSSAISIKISKFNCSALTVKS